MATRSSRAAHPLRAVGRHVEAGDLRLCISVSSSRRSTSVIGCVPPARSARWSGGAVLSRRGASLRRKPRYSTVWWRARASAVPASATVSPFRTAVSRISITSAARSSASNRVWISMRSTAPGSTSSARWWCPPMPSTPICKCWRPWLPCSARPRSASGYGGRSRRRSCTPRLPPPMRNLLSRRHRTVSGRAAPVPAGRGMTPATITLHGVLLDMWGQGVLLTGASGTGKSELALELVGRDAGLEGRCPPPLQDFLEVRGLGVINVRKMFGDGALTARAQLDLVLHLHRPHADESDALDRLYPNLDMMEVLDVAVPRITLAEKTGRAMAAVSEAAVRNQLLIAGCYDAAADLFRRQQSGLSYRLREVCRARRLLWTG